MKNFPDVKIVVPGQTEPESEAADSSMSSCSNSEPFALQVLGDSMEPEFPDKCVILIEPNSRCSSGAYVLANIEDSRWFRQYIKTDEGEQLVALNPNYPPIPLAGFNWKIEGIIVQRNIRRNVKHYDIY
jgi:SOS-response transcriptional repressor LexA